MTRSLTVPVGGTIRTMVCPLCDRQFRGDERNVNKIIRLHLEKAHNVKECKKLINNLVISETLGFLGPDDPTRRSKV